MMGRDSATRSARGARDRSRAPAKHSAPREQPRRAGPPIWHLAPGRDGQFGTRAVGALEVLLGEQPRDLQRVRGRALARVLQDEEEVEAAFLRRILADAADEHRVLVRHEDRHRVDALAGIVDQLHAPRRASVPRAAAASSFWRVVTFTAVAWP